MSYLSIQRQSGSPDQTSPVTSFVAVTFIADEWYMSRAVLTRGDESGKLFLGDCSLISSDGKQMEEGRECRIGRGRVAFREQKVWVNCLLI